MTTTIALTQFIVFMSYVFYVKRQFGVLESISTSTYYLEGLKRGYFFGFLGIVGLLNFLHIIWLPEMGSYIFLTSAGLIFTGITINHRNVKALTKYVHFGAVSVAIILGFLGFIIVHGIWTPVILCALTMPIIYWITKRNFIWYAEISAMIFLVMNYLMV